jgi:TonB-dependent SusC/RagA subfamily outer membrane receptor
MSKRVRLYSLFLGTLAAVRVGHPVAVAAQQGIGAIEGKVIDAGTARPIANARITIAGTTIRATTTDAGTFRIVGVPARQVDVRVRVIGFAPASKSIVVAAGQTVQADFQLTVSALQLEQVVVTGSGQQVEAKKLGNTVAVIQPPANAPINDMSALLQAREPGLSAINSAGLTGSGARIRIRGNASLTQSNEPVIFLDGIRINSGGGQTSRLEDIDPESVERIEVLKGAAAATLYGTEASNGVIQIFTKRGTNGPTRWQFGLQQETIQFPDRVAPNSGYAKTQAQADSTATYWHLGTLKPFQVFEIPIWHDYLSETGQATTTSGQVNGGSSAFTYFASGRYQHEDGPIGGKSLGPATDGLKRIQTGVNLTLVPFNNTRLGLRSGYYYTWNAIPGGGIIGNSIYGTYALALYARPELANCTKSTEIAPGDCSGPGNAFGNQAFMTVRESMQQQAEESVQRYNGSLSATYTPLREFTVDLVGGWDVSDTRSFSFSNRDLLPTLSSALVAGLQVFNVRSLSSGGSSTNFPGPGIEVVGAGGQNISVSEGLLTSINGGFFAQEQLG